MKTRMTLVASAVALMFAGAQAAFAKTNLHEEEWEHTNLYGSTTIAQDSPSEWGPWKEFVQPAAGPIAGPSIAMPGGIGGDAYRPLPVPSSAPSVPNVCGAGAWCGFAALYFQDWSGEEYVYSEHIPFAISLDLQPGGSGWDGSGTANMSGAPLDPNLANLFGDGSTGPIPVQFYGQPGDFEGSMYTDTSYAYIDGGEHSWAYDTSHQTEGIVLAYVAGDSGEYYYDGAEIGGAYVAGSPTPLSDMAALQAGNVQATYDGWTVYPHSTHNHFGESPVHIDVNFGTATWSGSWNNGVDGSVHTHTDYDGSTRLFGQVGFTASGTLTGSGIQSTSVGTNDAGATVSGYVVGQFTGSNAAGLVGLSDITKTVTGPGEGNQYGNTYTDARNVDLFITTRTDNVPK